jgi:RimJ/RimL family protein N-acetyltransferase
MTLRPYLPGDVWRFEPRPDFAVEREVTADLFERGALTFAWTVIQGVGLVGVAGALKVGKGTWSVASLLSALPRRDWPQALALAGQALAMLHREHAAAEIWASHRVANPAAMRTLARLGFRESTSMDLLPAHYDLPYRNMVKVL